MGASTAVGGDLQGGEGVSLLFCEQRGERWESREGGTALIRHRRVSPARLPPHTSGGNPASSLPRLTERRFPLCLWKRETEEKLFAEQGEGLNFPSPSRSSETKGFGKETRKKKKKHFPKKKKRRTRPFLAAGARGCFWPVLKTNKGTHKNSKITGKNPREPTRKKKTKKSLGNLPFGAALGVKPQLRG